MHQRLGVRDPEVVLEYHDDVVVDEAAIVDVASGRSQPTGSFAVAGSSGLSRDDGRQIEVVDLISADESDHQMPGLEVVPEFFASHAASLPAERSAVSTRPRGSRLRARLGLDRRQPAQIMPDGYYSSSDDEFLYEPPATNQMSGTGDSTNQMQVDAPGARAGRGTADPDDEAFADYLRDLEHSLDERDDLEQYENREFVGQDDSLLF